MRTLATILLSTALVASAAFVSAATPAQVRRGVKLLAQITAARSAGNHLDADTVGGLGPDAIVNRLNFPAALQTGTLDPLQTACLTVTCQGNARPISCAVSSSSYLVQIAALAVVVPGDPGSTDPSDYHCVACFLNNDSTNAQTIVVRPVCWTPLE